MDELLCRAFDEIYETEFDRYKTGKKHFFSLRHRRMMRKLFKKLDTKTESTATTDTYTYKAKRKRPAALVIAIIFSILLSITAVAVAIYSFGFKEYPTHTVVFSENIGNVPSTLEYLYVIEPLPDGYEKGPRVDGKSFSVITYENGENTLSLTQSIKKEYICNYNTEGCKIEKTDVNGHDGFYITIKNKTILVWDNGDYILELYGILDRNKLLKLAKNMKIEKI